MSKDTRQHHLRIFLASPGDVPDERAVARSVIDQTQYNPEWRGVVTLETVTWDKPGAVAMIATATPQASMAHQLPKPSECDIVIVIFWAWRGSPLPADLK
jgi:hypothetical protein